MILYHSRHYLDNIKTIVFMHSGKRITQSYIQELRKRLGQSQEEFANEFAVVAEVYTDSPNGRYKTVVDIPDTFDDMSSTYQSFTPGIFVDASSRTNVGCMNDSSSAAVLQLDIYSGAGALVNQYSLTVLGKSWFQAPLPDGVSGGYVAWKLQSGLFPYCWAVVVDNTSNDGTFVLPQKYVP